MPTQKKNAEKLVEPEIKDSPEKTKTVEKVYWSRAARMRLGNWVPEVRTGGKIDRREQALKWEEHIFVTSDPDKQEFIEESRAFKRNDIKLCKDAVEARTFSAQVAALKAGKKSEECRDESSVVIDVSGS
jgi:hypothetical protein